MFLSAFRCFRERERYVLQPEKMRVVRDKGQKKKGSRFTGGACKHALQLTPA